MYRDFRDTGYLPFDFQGYRILSILLPRIWETVFNIFVTFRDIEYLGKINMGIFANLKGILAYLLQGIWDIWYPPIQASQMKATGWFFLLPQQDDCQIRKRHKELHCKTMATQTAHIKVSL